MKKGFASVYLVLILGSLVSFVLIVCEAASGFAAGSIAENLCMTAGRSVLSEFNKELYSRYGIFALRSDGIFLEDMYSYYLQQGLGSSDGFLTMSCRQLSIDTEGYAGLDADALMPQVLSLGKLCAAEALLDSDGLSDLLQKLAALGGKDLGTEDVGRMLSDLKEQADEEEEAAAAEYTEDPGLEDSGDGGSAAQAKAKKKKSQISALKAIYEAAQRVGEASCEDGNTIPAEALALLPSAQLGTGSRSLLLLSGGLAGLSADSLLADEYMIHALGDLQEGREGSFLLYQCEYLLFGKASDRENAKACRFCIFRLRTALNTAALLADPSKYSELCTAAAMGFGLLPQPAAVMILAAVWGAAEASADTDELFSGGTVPYIKLSGDWTTSLNGLLSGLLEDALAEEAGPQSPDSACGDYDAYLRILMAMLPPEEKLVRLMDLMQMDVGLAAGTGFRFRDCCYGFNARVQLSKPSRFPGLSLERSRYGTIAQSYSYN